jgi:hypothetical protein
MINIWTCNYAKESGRRQSKVLFLQLPVRTEETHKNVSKGRGSPDPNMRGHLPDTKEDVHCELRVISYWSYIDQNLPTTWVKTASTKFRTCWFSRFGGGAYDRAERYDLHQSYHSRHALHAKLHFILESRKPLWWRASWLLKNAVFWDVVPCRSCVNRRFGGTYRFHLQGTKIRERGNVGSHKIYTVPYPRRRHSS